jgi:hypothetical protein
VDLAVWPRMFHCWVCYCEGRDNVSAALHCTYPALPCPPLAPSLQQHTVGAQWAHCLCTKLISSCAATAWVRRLGCGRCTYVHATYGVYQTGEVNSEGRSMEEACVAIRHIGLYVPHKPIHTFIPHSRPMDYCHTRTA